MSDLVGNGASEVVGLYRHVSKDVVPKPGITYHYPIRSVGSSAGKLRVSEDFRRI